MKNPFSKSSITDTLINVGLGGAANAAMDYAVANVDALASVARYTNYIKLGVGVLGGTMIKGKVARAAFDGLATVGASDIIKELITREQYPAPKVSLNPQVKDFYAFTTDDLIVEDYVAGPQVKNIPIAV